LESEGVHLKIRASIVAVVAAISSFALLAPAHAGGEVCYDVNVNVNGQVISQAGCQQLP